MKENRVRFLDSEVEPRPAKDCFYHVVPVPYEASVSYGSGTKKGPNAILEASNQLELRNNFGGLLYPGNRGIFTHEPIACDGDAPEVFNRIYGKVKEIIAMGGFPVILGGEHSLTFGAIKALKEILALSKNDTFGIVQFDAHADLRATYGGDKWSHASAMRRAVEDLGIPLVQLGNRAFCAEEVDARKMYNVQSFDAPYLAKNSIPEQLIPKDFPKKIFITFDVDALDPSIIPETGTPVPGGLLWYQALELAQKALQGRTLIGFDVVELSPVSSESYSAFTAAQLTYFLMALAD